MRKYFVMMFIAGLYMSFAILYSCDKEDTRPDDMKKDFEAAALLHTEAMELCLEVLKTTSVTDEKYLLELIKETTMKYVGSNPGFMASPHEAQKSLQSEIDRLVSFRKKTSSPGYKGDYTYNDYLIYTIHYFEEELSAGQYNLLLAINDIMQMHQTADVIIPLLTQIKDVDCLTLPEEERYVIYSVITIGIESVDYWSENMDAWIDAVTDGDPEKMDAFEKWFNWGSVSNSDIAGAVGGAIGGAITGSIAGGIGAGPGALLGGCAGGIGSSAADATMQVLNHFLGS